MQNEKWQRLQTLRNRDEKELLQSEREELAVLLSQMDKAEQNQLRGATQQLRIERQNIEAQNQVLNHLVQRKEQLKTRLQSLLSEAQAERRAIDAEVSRVLSGSSSFASNSPS